MVLNFPHIQYNNYFWGVSKEMVGLWVQIYKVMAQVYCSELTGV